MPVPPQPAEPLENTSVEVTPNSRLVLVRRAGYALLGIQLLALWVWSWTLYHRFALTWDFGVYNQPWYLIAHGRLDPPTSIESMSFWRNDAEFAIWPLAIFWWVLPHDTGLLWLQDMGVVAAEMVAFSWMCQLSSRGKHAPWLAGAGLMLFLASPWLWWSVSFDFHMESVAIPFAVLLARDLLNGRRRFWFWVLPVLLSGAPAAVYVVGIGIGGILSGRRLWTSTIALVMVGATWSAFVVMIGADHGAPLARHYGYLAVGVAASYVHGRVASGASLTTGQMVKGILGHPWRIGIALWQKRQDVAAVLLPSGLLGAAFRGLAPLIVIGIMSSVLSAGWRFAQPSFQLLPAYVLIPVGTVAVLAWLGTRNKRAALLAAGLIAVQALGWTVVWAPQVREHWLRVSPAAAATLAKVRAQVPESDEVVASQGVLGPFSGREAVHAIASTARTEVTGSEVWFVIAPSAGTELQSTASSMALIAKLAGPMHGTLMAHGGGVWAFRWHRPEGQRWVTVPDGMTGVPAWAAAGQAGTVTLSGSSTSWHVTSSGRQGYVTDGMEWLEPPGEYQASVSMAVTGTANVEVWDNTGQSRLLTRRTITSSGGRLDVSLPIDASADWRSSVFSGWGPFSAVFVPPVPGQRLEVRVWTTGEGRVRVYGASLKQAT